jgi:hypothetical protein
MMKQVVHLIPDEPLLSGTVAHFFLFRASDSGASPMTGRRCGGRARRDCARMPTHYSPDVAQVGFENQSGEG